MPDEELPEEAKKQLPDSGEILEITDQIPGENGDNGVWAA